MQPSRRYDDYDKDTYLRTYKESVYDPGVFRFEYHYNPEGEGSEYSSGGGRRKKTSTHRRRYRDSSSNKSSRSGSQSGSNSGSSGSSEKLSNRTGQYRQNDLKHKLREAGTRHEKRKKIFKMEKIQPETTETEQSQVEEEKEEEENTDFSTDEEEEWRARFNDVVEKFHARMIQRCYRTWKANARQRTLGAENAKIREQREKKKKIDVEAIEESERKRFLEDAQAAAKSKAEEEERKKVAAKKLEEDKNTRRKEDAAHKKMQEVVQTEAKIKAGEETTFAQQTEDYASAKKKANAEEETERGKEAAAKQESEEEDEYARRRNEGDEELERMAMTRKRHDPNQLVALKQDKEEWVVDKVELRAARESAAAKTIQKSYRASNARRLQSKLATVTDA